MTRGLLDVGIDARGKPIERRRRDRRRRGGPWLCWRRRSTAGECGRQQNGEGDWTVAVH